MNSNKNTIVETWKTKFGIYKHRYTIDNDCITGQDDNFWMPARDQGGNSLYGVYGLKAITIGHGHTFTTPQIIDLLPHATGAMLLT
jgi:hypothetical protein